MNIRIYIYIITKIYILRFWLLIPRIGAGFVLNFPSPYSDVFFAALVTSYDTHTMHKIGESLLT